MNTNREEPTTALSLAVAIIISGLVPLVSLTSAPLQNFAALMGISGTLAIKAMIDISSKGFYREVTFVIFWAAFIMSTSQFIIELVKL